jgi:hypothetical protein
MGKHGFDLCFCKEELSIVPLKLFLFEPTWIQYQNIEKSLLRIVRE